MEQGVKEIAVNRKAYHDFEIIDKYQAGLVLFGPEIKSIRLGKVQLKDSYISFIHHEAFVKGMHISKFKEASIFNQDEDREKKLLLNKHEIIKLENKIKLDGLTIVPLRLYLSSGFAKLEIALARGKNEFDKRQSDKERTMKMEAKKATYR